VTRHEQRETSEHTALSWTHPAEKQHHWRYQWESERLRSSVAAIHCLFNWYNRRMNPCRTSLIRWTFTTLPYTRLLNIILNHFYSASPMDFRYYHSSRFYYPFLILLCLVCLIVKCCRSGLCRDAIQISSIDWLIRWTRFIQQPALLLKVLPTISPLLAATCTEAEKSSFSCLRHLKSFCHNTMSQERLNHVWVLHVHQELLDTVDITEVAKDFAEKYDSRHQMLGFLPSHAIAWNGIDIVRRLSVCLSVCPSVCDVDDSWSHTLS